MGMAENKRRRPSHDDEEDHRQQAADADADVKEKKKPRQHRQLPVPLMTKEFASRYRNTVLPRVLTEYTTEDAARFDEDMARTDKFLDELADRVASFHPDTSRAPVVPFITPGLRLLYDNDGEQEEEVVVGDLRVSVPKADLKMLRSFAAPSRGYHPFPEKFLSDRSLFAQAAADEISRSDRVLSKLYAWSQEGAREFLRHYDAAAAKGT